MGCIGGRRDQHAIENRLVRSLRNGGNWRAAARSCDEFAILSESIEVSLAPVILRDRTDDSAVIVFKPDCAMLAALERLMPIDPFDHE